ncbi:hypothetical protein CL621_02875, partial [archaeon]|nr:hypothetical protein [archaeon]
LKDIINKSTPQKDFSKAKKLIDLSINLMIKLWRYGIHEKTFKFTSNIGVINKDAVLLDIFELTDNKMKVKKQIKKKPWDKFERLSKEMPEDLARYFIKQANKKFTIINLNKNWMKNAKAK